MAKATKNGVTVPPPMARPSPPTGALWHPNTSGTTSPIQVRFIATGGAPLVAQAQYMTDQQPTRTIELILEITVDSEAVVADVVKEMTYNFEHDSIQAVKIIDYV